MEHDALAYELVMRTCQSLVRIFELDQNRNRLMTGEDAAELVREFKRGYSGMVQEENHGR